MRDGGKETRGRARAHVHTHTHTARRIARMTWVEKHGNEQIGYGRRSFVRTLHCAQLEWGNVSLCEPLCNYLIEFCINTLIGVESGGLYGSSSGNCKNCHNGMWKR